MQGLQTWGISIIHKLAMLPNIIIPTLVFQSRLKENSSKVAMFRNIFASVKVKAQKKAQGYKIVWWEVQGTHRRKRSRQREGVRSNTLAHQLKRWKGVFQRSKLAETKKERQVWRRSATAGREERQHCNRNSASPCMKSVKGWRAVVWHIWKRYTAGTQ